MGFYVNSEDFTGKFQISQGMYNSADIDDFIQRYELRYLVELLGVDLYNLYYADSVNEPDHIPASQIYKDLYYAFNKQYDFTLCISTGIKDMLIGFIWWEYNKALLSENTLSGEVKKSSENSTPVVSTMYARYNESIKTYRSIQTFIMKNYNQYSNFRGINKTTTWWL